MKSIYFVTVALLIFSSCRNDEEIITPIPEPFIEQESFDLVATPGSWWTYDRKPY